MKCYDVGNNIFISDYEYCNSLDLLWIVNSQFRPEFDKFIHIYRGDLEKHDVCNVSKFLARNVDWDFHGKAGLGLNVQHGEGQDISHIAQEVYNYSIGNDKLLIHCAAGQTRGPTLALLAKVARGMSLIGSIGEITDAFRQDPKRGDFPLFHAVPLRSIERFLWK